MKKLLLTLFLILSLSFLGKSQYVSDRYTFFPDIYADSSTIVKGDFTIDFVQRNDSTILILERHDKKLKSELNLEAVISQKFDKDNFFWVSFTAINVELKLPEIVVIVKQGKEIVSVGISNGEAMAKWDLKRKEENIL